MKTIKPQRLGVLTRTFEKDGEYFLVVTILVGFRFDAPEVPLHEAELWRSVTARLEEETALDEAMVKTRAEVLVSGSAFQPGGASGIGCAAKLVVGAAHSDEEVTEPWIDKTLYVVGDRTWGTTGPSEPTPFIEMPVTWRRAFGGSGVASNPLGRGAETVTDKDGSKRHPLPNVEDPSHLIKSRGDKPPPAGFGPVDARAGSRQKRSGTYDKKWLDSVYPAYPSDFDWEFFNVAPLDQRRDDWFVGGEAFLIENMHPDKTKLRGTVPRLVGRCFITREGDDGATEIREVATKLDTVHLFPDLELGVVSLRGVTTVSEDDAIDVRELMIAAELAGQPKPVSHYHTVLANRLDREKAPLFFLRDQDLLPPLPEGRDPMGHDEISDLPELLAVDSLIAKNLRKKAEEELERLREICRSHDLDPDEHLPKELPPAEDEQPPIESLDTYIDEKRAEAKAAREEAERQQAQAIAEARRMCTEQGVDFDELMEAAKKDGAGPPEFRAETELAKLRDIKVLSENAGVPIPAVDAKLADPELLAKLQATERQLFEAYRRNAHEFPAASRLDAEASEEVAVRLRAAIDAGEALAGYDFTGVDAKDLAAPGANMAGVFLEAADLSGADLSGADLTDAVLVRANLVGANLEGAKLVGANLAEADLGEANLSGCDLSGANFTRARLRDTSLENSVLQRAFLFETQVSGGSFAGVRASQLFFHELNLSGVDLSGAELPQCIFVESQVEDANFNGALLEGACFVTVNADRSTFDDARCDNLRVVHGCSMDGVSFKNAQLASANFRDTSMRGACLQSATAPNLDLSGCDLEGGALDLLVAPSALLIRTSLKGATLTRANLMESILQKANIEGADFQGANLFRGDFAKIKGDADTNFDGANMKFIRFVNREQHG